MHPRKRDFLIGSIGYPLVEYLYRGRSHWTMSLAGGGSFLLLRRIRKTHQSRPLWQQALLGGLSITAIEYALGRGFNRRHQIWDYRRVPMNWKGHICLPYSACWCALSAALLSLMRKP